MRAGTLFREGLSCLGLRMSWLTVGIYSLLWRRVPFGRGASWGSNYEFDPGPRPLNAKTRRREDDRTGGFAATPKDDDRSSVTRTTPSRPRKSAVHTRKARRRQRRRSADPRVSRIYRRCRSRASSSVRDHRPNRDAGARCRLGNAESPPRGSCERRPTPALAAFLTAPGHRRLRERPPGPFSSSPRSIQTPRQEGHISSSTPERETVCMEVLQFGQSKSGIYCLPGSPPGLDVGRRAPVAIP